MTKESLSFIADTLTQIAQSIPSLLSAVPKFFVEHRCSWLLSIWLSCLHSFLLQIAPEFWHFVLGSILGASRVSQNFRMKKLTKALEGVIWNERANMHGANRPIVKPVPKCNLPLLVLSALPLGCHPCPVPLYFELGHSLLSWPSLKSSG